jgi:hypothetical protein
MTLINRGFGGSHISDVNHFIEETVIQYSPDVVLHYAGDNDTAAGKSSEQIFEDYQEFVKSILTAKPGTEILFISIKPSLSRWAVWPQMVETNEGSKRSPLRVAGLVCCEKCSPRSRSL